LQVALLTRKQPATAVVRETVAQATAVAVAVENKMTDHTKRLLGTLFVLLLIVAVVFGLGMFKLYLSGSRESVWPTGVVESYRAGDYQAAVENTAKIVSNPNKTEEAKANAIYNSLGAAYRLSGDKKDMMTDIQNMKNIITNESLSLEIRAATLDVLAKEYDLWQRSCSFCRNIQRRSIQPVPCRRGSVSLKPTSR
jgi:hypothetical protein